SEPVRRHPAAEMNSDGANLLAVHPNARAALQELAGDGKIGQCIDDGLLQRAYIRYYVALPSTEIEDRIRHQLTGAMICHIAAAVGVMKFDAGTHQHRSEERRVGKE